MFIPFGIFSIYAGLSGVVNGNLLLVTLLGTFDYLKNFLVIFIYAAFFNDPKHFKIIFRVLLIMALLFGTVALIQFVWAMGSVYILKKEITDKSIYILSMGSDYSHLFLTEIIWRYGIFKTASLTYHSYILGLFNLLIFTIYLHTRKRANRGVIMLLVSGVIASVSRMAYGGLIAVITFSLMRKRVLALLLMIVILIFTFAVIHLNDDLNMSSITNSYFTDNEEGLKHEYNIRAHTRDKSIEIWKDHPAWGIGPGMFGGIVASKYKSHVYKEYNVANLRYILSIGGIEQFWFQLLAETGLIGTLFFCGLLISLFMFLHKSKERAVSEDIKGLFSALKVFIACIVIYSFGSGINVAPVLFPYCALSGIGLGIANRQLNK